MDNNLVLDVHERPPILKGAVFALQHVFAMFGATILVPILVNGQAGMEVMTIPVALVTSGIGTIIYTLCTGGKSPVYLGSSFAFIAPCIAAAVSGGPGAAMSGIMVVGAVYIIVALIIRAAGKEWLNKLLPPVVIGPMIMIIGLGLAPTAVGQIGITSGAQLDWKHLAVAIAAFGTAVVASAVAKGFLKVVPFLLGIIVGYLCAVVLGVVDFSAVSTADWVGAPRFLIPFKDYPFDMAAALVIAPIALVTISEHIGDHISLSKILNRDLIKDPGLDRTLLGDGIASLVAGFLGGPANTTYGENTAVVGMTKVASVWVIRLAAIFAIILGFLGKFTAVAAAIPGAVLGGISLLLYGFIAANGLRVLIESKVNLSQTKNVIIVSTMLVLGIGGAVLSIGNVQLSGMSLAAIIGIVLNLVLPEEKAKT